MILDGQSFLVIMNRMLGRVPADMDKREGSIIWDAMAPAAIEIESLYTALNTLLDESFADTASRPYLIKRCAERGIVPYGATCAVLRGEFDKDIPIGSRFSLDDYNYCVTERIASCIYKLTCETPGIIGGERFGNLVPIEYIAGLQSAKLTELLIPGEDPEDTELLRARYMDSFDSQAYGGNIKDYQTKVNELPGVGGVKVYPVWQGGGTVKLVIINSDFQKPSEELVKTVQNLVHPPSVDGVSDTDTSGSGIAPIGHIVTVFGVDTQKVDVELSLTLHEGWLWDDVSESVHTAIDAYFLELSKSWEKESGLVVRISQIELRVLGLSGILDVTDTILNGIRQNLSIDEGYIPIRGEVHGI